MGGPMAGPAARKISATSRGRAPPQPVEGDLSGPEHARELVERAGHGAHRSGSDLGVEGGVVQLRVPEQNLDDADVDAVFQQMGGKAVPVMPNAALSS